MRIVRRLFQALIFVLTLTIGASSAAIIVSQTAWFKDWLRTYLVRESHQFLNGQLAVGRLAGNLFTGVQLEDVSVSMDGRELITIGAVELDYNVVQLVTRGLSIDDIRIVRPSVHLRRDAGGWTIARLIRRQEREADREGPRAPITIDAIRIHDGTLAFDEPLKVPGVNVPRRFERIDAGFSFSYEPVHYSVELAHASFRASEPELSLNALSGGIAVRGDTFFVERLALETAETSLSLDGSVQHYLSRPVLNVTMSSGKIALPELAPIVPALAGIKLQPALDLKLDGPMDRLGVETSVRSSAGEASASMKMDLMAPGQSASGTVSFRRVNLAPLLKDRTLRTDLTADAKVDIRAEAFSNLESYAGTVSVRAPRVAGLGYEAQRINGDVRFRGRTLDIDARASAYGSDATARGRVSLARDTRPLQYDLQGRVARFDLRRMPERLALPEVETSLQAAYHVRGAEPVGGRGGRTLEAEATFGESSFAGARIADGSTAAVTLQGRDLAYRADATMAGVDLERIGRELNVPALSSSRYRTNVNGHVTAEGRGTDPKTMELAASGTLHDSTLLEGEVPELTFDSAFAADTLRVKAAGAFAGFNPAVLSGREAMDGDVAGSLDVDVTATAVSEGVRPDTLTASGRVSLGRSTIGGIVIDRAMVDADYRDSTGDIRTLEIAGLDLNVRASGTIALNDTGASALTVHADTPSVEAVGKLFDVPVHGIASVDAAVTGNRRELVARGTLTGSGVKYEENGALTLSSDFTVRVPDLAFERAEADTVTEAAFVTVAGQEINELTATANYADRRLEVDGAARQRERTLAVAGELVLHPDHQEVHVTRASLDTRGMRWELAPGSEATVAYAGERIDVEGLRLVSGDQTIAADGSFGAPGDTLNVTLRNVNLESVDAMLLRTPQFGGRANVTATVKGTKSAPEASASFEVANGSFRSFKYDSLGGTMNYAGRGITLDARLQQNPAQWATAKGYLPLALFSRPADETPDRDVHVPAVSPEDRVDIAVETSPIDLGVVQGFTTALTEVTGTVQANVRVTGSAQDPHPEGTISIDKGFATVNAVGVRYRNITGRIDLQPDRVHVDRITLLDNQENQLTVSGDLAVHERQAGAVQLRIVADDFKVVDNKLGNVRVRSDLAITGELRAPRVEGTLDVTTGTVNVDEIAAMVGPSAYSTRPMGLAPGAEPADESAAEPGIFENLTMDVRVQVPNDLVIKASSLETAGSPIGLGALNVTLGGDVRATKQRGDILRLVGVVNTVRGNYDFQGRRFEILRDGSIRFEGLDRIDPRLDIRTRRLIQGVEARADIRGTLREPEIRLSSTPPFPEADILSLIVFNVPINELGAGEQISLAARAQSLATGAVANQIASSIGGILNLDTFEINLAPEFGDAPEITFGEQVGKNLYVKIRQAVGDLSTTNLIIEYVLTDWLRLRGNVVQNGTQTQQSLFKRAETSGADMIFFFSY